MPHVRQRRGDDGIDCIRLTGGPALVVPARDRGCVSPMDADGYMGAITRRMQQTAAVLVAPANDFCNTRVQICTHKHTHRWAMTIFAQIKNDVAMSEKLTSLKPPVSPLIASTTPTASCTEQPQHQSISLGFSRNSMSDPHIVAHLRGGGNKTQARI